MKKQEKNKLIVDFNDEQRQYNYSGTIGGLIGNLMILIQMIYNSLKNKQQKKVFKENVIKLVNHGLLFMTEEEIEEFMKKEGVIGNE